MYGVLDQYQKEGYQALMKIGNRYGGAFLCDGVGLGKTFVGLMLIERLIMHDGKNVVLLVPKAANEPVWEPAIRPESPESTRSIVQARRTIVAKLFADLRPITPQNTTNVAALAVFGWVRMSRRGQRANSTCRRLRGRWTARLPTIGFRNGHPPST